MPDASTDLISAGLHAAVTKPIKDAVKRLFKNAILPLTFLDNLPLL